jgi:hypothetical protein
MSSSDSNSSSVDDHNPNPKPLDYQFETLNLEQGSGSTIIQNDVDEEGRQQDQGSSLNGSLNVNSNNHEQDDGIGLVRGVVLRRTNSEVEVDVNGPSSPSSSGYAGERGSSGVSEDDEIEEVANDSALHEVFDSQAAWLPGKRHVDEVLFGFSPLFFFVLKAWINCEFFRLMIVNRLKLVEFTISMLKFDL